MDFQLCKKPKSYAVSAYAPFSPWSAKPGTSDAIAFESTLFETESSMHDPTVAVSSTATSGTTTTLTDTGQSWTVNQYAGAILKLTGGTGSGQWRSIASNTATVLTVGTAFGTAPDATTTYKVFEFASRLVAPVDGIYQVTGHASIDYNATVLGIFFYVNGSFAALHYEHQAQSIEMNNGFSKALELSTGDYVEMRIYNGDGSNYRNMFGGQFRLWCQMFKV